MDGDCSTCPVHPSRKLSSFCEDHDLVICEECIKYDHRLCKNVVDVDAASRDLKKHVEYKTTLQVTENLRNDLVEVRKAREDDKDRVKQEQEHIKYTMEATIQKMQTTLLSLQVACNNAVDKKSREFHSTISSDIRKLEETLSKVEETLTGLKQDNQTALLTMKRDRQFIYTSKKTVSDFLQHVRKETMSLDVNPIFNDAIKQTSFGDILYTNPKLPPAPKIFNGECEYTAKLRSKYNVNVDADQFCNITGSCLLQNGSVVLIDNSHDKIIHLDQEYTISGWCDIPGKPWGICTIGSTQLAVTVFGKKSVQLVSLKTGQMEATTHFSVGVPCRGICFKSGNLYVICGGGTRLEGSGMVNVFNTDGIKLNTFQVNSMGEQIFGRPMDIAFNAENRLFYITDEKKGVITLDEFGKYVSTLNHENLIAARGIAFDNRRQIFVGCSKSKQVFLFHENGKQINIPIQRDLNIIPSMRSLMFLTDSDKLLVTSNSNSIYMFEIFEIKAM